MEAKGNLVISLDFELFWGVTDSRTIQGYGQDILKGRESIPKLLELFAKYGVHATWGTVGMLFAQSKEQLETFLPTLRPQYDNQKLCAYRHFETIGADETEDPLHYAPSLIKTIMAYEGQEIGSHTFCHYYCNEPGQTLEAFAQDTAAVKKIAQQTAGAEIKSFIFPRNHFKQSYLNVLKEHDVLAVRGNPKGIAYSGGSMLSRVLRMIDSYIPILGSKSYDRSECVQDGIANIKASLFFRKYNGKLAFLEPLKLWNIKYLMKIAARKGKVFHLWWHPHNMGRDPERFLAQIEQLLIWYKKLHEEYGFESKNMGELAAEVLYEKDRDAVR